MPQKYRVLRIITQFTFMIYGALLALMIVGFAIQGETRFELYIPALLLSGTIAALVFGIIKRKTWATVGTLVFVLFNTVSVAFAGFRPIMILTLLFFAPAAVWAALLLKDRMFAQRA